MKRLFIALALSVALAALIGSGIYFTNDRLTALQQRLDQIYAVAQTDLAQAAPLCEQATQEWEASQKILCIYLSEQDLDQIGMQIARLEPLALGGDTAGPAAARPRSPGRWGNETVGGHPQGLRPLPPGRGL